MNDSAPAGSGSRAKIASGLDGSAASRTSPLCVPPMSLLRQVRLNVEPFTLASKSVGAAGMAKSAAALPRRCSSASSRGPISIAPALHADWRASSRSLSL